MAKHKLSAMFSDLRGKLNGSKFSKGRSVHTLTNKVKGANPRTSSQGRVRSFFRKWSAAWKELSENQILAWNQAALEFTRRNIFGDSYSMTGHKLYVMMNVNASLLGGAELENPPVIEIPTVVDIGTLVCESDPAELKFSTSDDLDADCALVVTATPQYSKGKTNVKGKFRYIGQFNAPQTGGVKDILTLYTDKFGSLVAGKKLSIIVYTTDKLRCLKFPAPTSLSGIAG